jgi:hypothetical protein
MADEQNESLEERKVKALENIAETLDLMLEWVEEIDKEGWDERLQWYLGVFKQKFVDGTYEPEKIDNAKDQRK